MSKIQFRFLGLACLALLAASPLFLNPFSMTLLNYIGVYGLVALGLVLLTGIGGMMSFGQAAFVGIGAYAGAWATALQGYSPWVGLLLAVTLSSAVALVLGAITLRLGGHFLALSTVAWGLSIFFLFGNLEGLGNYNGIPNVPPISLGSLKLIDSWQMFYLIWLLVLMALLLSRNLLDSRAGRAVRALRGGNLLVESLGINAFATRLATFVIAALFAGLSGWLYAHLNRIVSPAPFEVHVGIDYLMMAMVGGATELIGAFIGAALVTLTKNSIQDYLPLIAKGASGQLEIVAFSIVFIVLLQRWRGGLISISAHLLPSPHHEIDRSVTPLPRRVMPQRGDVLLKVDQVERRFGGLVAVEKVSFTLNAGEILGLIGPNGAGKSTMFNLLTGALRPNSGQVLFEGRDITHAPQRNIAKGGIARTFQHVKIRPKMTLLDNVLLGTHPRTSAGFLTGALRLDREEEAKARAEAMRQLERVGLGDKPFELAGNLPLGNQRVLEIARALAADPVLLVLDEPAAGLRRQEKQALAELLKSLRDENLTILLVEHDMDFVMGLVDRIVVMNFGCKICEGLPAEVRQDRQVQDAYLGGLV